MACLLRKFTLLSLFFCFEFQNKFNISYICIFVCQKPDYTLPKALLQSYLFKVLIGPSHPSSAKHFFKRVMKRAMLAKPLFLPLIQVCEMLSSCIIMQNSKDDLLYIWILLFIKWGGISSQQQLLPARMQQSKSWLYVAIGFSSGWTLPIHICRCWDVAWCGHGS